jgi:hypothetical protein
MGDSAEMIHRRGVAKAAVNRTQSRRFARFQSHPEFAKRLDCGCFSTALSDAREPFLLVNRKS